MYKTISPNPTIHDFTEFSNGHSLEWNLERHVEIFFKSAKTDKILKGYVYNEFDIFLGDFIIAVNEEETRTLVYEVTFIEKISDFLYVGDFMFCGYFVDEKIVFLEGYGIYMEPPIPLAPTPEIEQRKIDWLMIAFSLIGLPILTLEWFTMPYANTYPSFRNFMYMMYTYPIRTRRTFK